MTLAETITASFLIIIKPGKGCCMKSKLLKQCLLILFQCVALSATPTKPTIPNVTFKITTYGAVGDGVTDNAGAIQAAIKAASGAGGGIVEFPSAAKPYESGPITLSGNINYQIDSGATLQCILYSKYPLSGSSYVNFISASNAQNLEISGKGAIDGQGPIGGALSMRTAPCPIVPI